MSSEEFFDPYSKGQLPDAASLIDWANDYRHNLVLRAELEEQLRHTAWSPHGLSRTDRICRSLSAQCPHRALRGRNRGSWGQL